MTETKITITVGSKPQEFIEWAEVKKTGWYCYYGSPHPRYYLDPHKDIFVKFDPNEFKTGKMTEYPRTQVVPCDPPKEISLNF